jgi:hypothetical protein
MILPTLIRIAGICHFGILIASALTPKVLDWRNELRKLNPLSRHMIWTHGAFIVLTILAFGTVSVSLPEQISAGTPLARAIAAFIGIFWLARLAIQFFLFDARPHLTTKFLTLGYHGLTIVFTYLAAVYVIAAFS